MGQMFWYYLSKNTKLKTQGGGAEMDPIPPSPLAMCLIVSSKVRQLDGKKKTVCI